MTLNSVLIEEGILDYHKALTVRHRPRAPPGHLDSIFRRIGHSGQYHEAILVEGEVCAARKPFIDNRYASVLTSAPKPRGRDVAIIQHGQ